MPRRYKEHGMSGSGSEMNGHDARDGRVASARHTTILYSRIIHHNFALACILVTLIILRRPKYSIMYDSGETRPQKKKQKQQK